MQAHRTAGLPPAQSLAAGSWTGKVLGLGVTDLLRVELEPVQVPAFVEQLAVTRRVCADEVARDEVRWEAMPEWQRVSRPPRVVEAGKDLDASRFNLRALDVIGSQLRPDGDDLAIKTIIGPSRIVSELVRETAQRVVLALNERLEERPRGDAAARERLLQTAVAASAWVETFVDCEAIEWFRFAIDPIPTGS